MRDAEGMVLGRLFALSYLVNIPEAPEVDQWLKALAQVGLSVEGLHDARRQ
ncbi:MULTISPECIES: hypothetical protein [Cupriavidus]